MPSLHLFKIALERVIRKSGVNTRDSIFRKFSQMSFTDDSTDYFSFSAIIWCTKYAPGVLNYTIREAEYAPSPYRLKITTTNLKDF
ncbi:hypothetical protein TNIN_484251 [Trichonephila inaurata madagascariensis]|uniref:Uncharacterized protein n=1 Tax=Trichonephila inaurata madagascariensis TaxID=2747483 RepID=A0A8X6MFX1_9ARAC|nr:hypothetical protein TNIN_484251 [Trichonephila inaurata madagascariensis]